MTEEITNTVQPTEAEMRTAEVAAYAANIANYTNMLSTLNGEWDADLAQFENMDQQDAARSCPMDRLQRLAELQLHKQVTNLLKTETVEHFKASAILNSVLNR